MAAFGIYLLAKGIETEDYDTFYAAFYSIMFFTCPSHIPFHPRSFYFIFLQSQQLICLFIITAADNSWQETVSPALDSQNIADTGDGNDTIVKAAVFPVFSSTAKTGR